ncbi:MAG: hypothetical protein PHN82_03890 [bacterium]|nr:hypothetical protein [bacterium]
MIISRTPVRVSFLGGGTDYPEYTRRGTGMTLCTSIDKYSYITVSRLSSFFDYRIRVNYSRTELVKAVDEILHPSVRECLRYMGIDGGVEIHYVGDLPARTGLGSSSSFTVGLLHALYAYKGQMVDKRRLAEEAVHVEREMIGERVGLQDQYVCAFGGLLHLTFSDALSVDVRHVILPEGRLEALQERLLLFYTGIQRNAHDILEEQMERTARGDLAGDLDRLGALVPRGVEILSRGDDLAAFGELLHENWLIKKRLSGAVSTTKIDEYYEAARKAGATGGKLCGAGGGGFILLYAEPYNRDKVRRALRGLLEVRFSLEHEGSTVIFYRP